MMMFEVSLDAFTNYLYLKLKKLITKKNHCLRTETYAKIRYQLKPILKYACKANNTCT